MDANIFIIEQVDKIPQLLFNIWLQRNGLQFAKSGPPEIGPAEKEGWDSDDSAVHPDGNDQGKGLRYI